MGLRTNENYFYSVFSKKKMGKVCRFRKKQYLCTRIQGSASYN